MKYLLLFCFLASAFHQVDAQQIVWESIASGVWRGTVGEAEAYNLLTAAGTKPNSSALSRMGQASFPIGKEEIKAKLLDGKTYLQFPLDKDEEVFGFGLNFKTIHQRGRIMRLHVDHYGGLDNGRTHAPVPFYVTSKGYGVFINSSRYLDVYAGTGSRLTSKNPAEALDRNTNPEWTASPYSDAVEILVPAKGVEFYVFAGPSMLEAVQRFNLFNGGGPIPPRWGLGFTQRVHRLFDQDQVLAEVNDFEERGFPLDFIGLEPGWQSKSYPNTFEWDESRFPDPEQLIQKLKEKHISLNLWINPYVSPEASFYDKLKPYYGSHTVWAGAVPDLSIPEAQKIYWKAFKEDHIVPGIGGYKIDEVDGYDRWLWPDVAQFPSGLAAEQLRQTYGLLVQKQSSDLFREQNRRTYGLVRASNGGGVSFPYVIYNDYYDHKDFITALINSGFSGLLWTPEARASKSPEEWLRRFQTVVFSPMAMINAWASGTKPWSYPEVAQEVKEMALLRMKMMPYWYSSFALYHFEGIPPFRAMQLEKGFTINNVDQKNGSSNLEENPYNEAIKKELKDQYMAGPSLLVAPIFAGENTRKVVLPKGKWYDFYSGKYVGNGEIITITARLDQIPVFVKDGGIVPLMEAMLHAPGKNQRYDLEILHYGESPGHFTLYDDDGISFDYENGHYSWRDINVSKESNGKWKGTISTVNSQKPDNIGKVSWTFMSGEEGQNPVK